MIGLNIDRELIAFLLELKPEMKNISIGFIDLFINNILKLIDETKKQFETKKINFESLGFKRDKYLSRIKGCETSCPCCGRLCDAEHYKVQTEIGSETNRHKCNRGHQFRGMNGFKYEHSNKPSFKLCDSMKNTDVIRYSGKIYKWEEFKAFYPKWDFESDSTQNVIDWTNKCTYIWSIIGKNLCEKFDMTYTSVAVDDPIDENQVVPIHFILVLDDSGSMSSENRWQSLERSVGIFLESRYNQGSPNDLVTIILFSVNATIEISNSAIYPQLINQIRQPSFGNDTNYSAALEKCMQVINQFKSSTHKYAIVFMSDGQANYPTNQIASLKDNYMNEILKFWCIGYGKENFKVLKDMLKELYGNLDNFKNPQDSIELDNAYKAISIEIAPEERK